MRPFTAVSSTVLAAGLLWESVVVAGGLAGLLISAGLSSNRPTRAMPSEP